MNVPEGQVEKVLEDLIHRLVNSETTPDVKAALIEARRLRNVTNRWAAIPPPPDARREMLALVMDLVGAIDTPKSPESMRGGAHRSSEEPPRGSAPPRSSPGKDAPGSKDPPRKKAPTEEIELLDFDSVLDAKLDGASEFTPPPKAVAAAISKPPAANRGAGKSDAPNRAAAKNQPTKPPPGARSKPPETAPASGPSSKAPTKRAVEPLGSELNNDDVSLELEELQVPRPPALPGSNKPMSLKPPPPGRSATTPQPFEKSASSTPGPSERTPIRAVGGLRGGGLEGFSSAISSPARKAISVAPPPVRNETVKPIEALKKPGPPQVPQRSATPMPATRDIPTARTMSPLPVSRSVTPSPSRSPAPTPPPSPHPGRKASSGAGLRLSVKSDPEALRGAGSRLPETKPPPPLTFSDPARAESPRTQRGGSSEHERQTIPADEEISIMFGEGLNLVRPDGADWQPHPVWAGTAVKLLYHDPLTGDYTALVKLEMGSTLPSRRHAKPEEMWMISGSATIASTEMRPGQYARADLGSVHPPVHSPAGCTFLLRGSEHDEVLLES